jgi:hypothetical protein
MTFPALIPSSRVFTPGEYPATAFNGYSGAQNRVRHSNVFLASQLRLTYKAASEADMLAIWRHYAGTQGSYESFLLPSEALSGVSIADYVPSTYRWIYAGPGSVEDLPCGGHNISLTLESVPPLSASVIGVKFRIALSLAAGQAVGDVDAGGISEAIDLALATGAALDAQNGLNESIELTLTAGQALNTLPGLHESIELVLDAGAAASTSGISGVLDLAVTTGDAFVDLAGIDEAVDLVLVGGAATEEDVAPTDPDFASVSLLLHLDGSNGSTTFTDSSNNQFTVTRGGDAQLSTANPKFGTASVKWDGTGDFLRTPSDVLFEFGTGDFTIEFWSYFDSSFDTSAAAILFAIGSFRSLYFISPNLQLRTHNGFNTLISGTALSLAAWHHIALVKSGSNHLLFADGAQVGSTYFSSDSYTTQRITFGTNDNGTNNYIGEMDEIRITKGVARYTANFSPPTAPFPDS